MLLLPAVLLIPGPGSAAAAFTLPRLRAATESPPTTARGSGRLQEVAPPAGVLQIREALEEREPTVRIEAPRAESLIPAGPWRLRLRVDDWPLVDAGPLGFGPHIVVQLDDTPPQRLVSPEATMPPLAPGSHRLTVYAAWPWGEAVKSPGAWTQIRLHRVAANPQALPAPGTPQLIPVSPAPEADLREPVLLDWLLIDAPLQHLRPEDTSWRLRVTANGDSLLLDRPASLWLKGWRRGSNALQLELVDGRGEPINPPFNSTVSELRIVPEAPSPPWLSGPIEALDLARLLGEAPPQVEAAPPSLPANDGTSASSPGTSDEGEAVAPAPEAGVSSSGSAGELPPGPLAERGAATRPDPVDERESLRPAEVPAGDEGIESAEAATGDAAAAPLREAGLQEKEEEDAGREPPPAALPEAGAQPQAEAPGQVAAQASEPPIPPQSAEAPSPEAAEPPAPEAAQAPVPEPAAEADMAATGDPGPAGDTASPEPAAVAPDSDTAPPQGAPESGPVNGEAGSEKPGPLARLRSWMAR